MNFKNKHPRSSSSRGGCFCGGKWDKKVTGAEKRKYVNLPDAPPAKFLSAAKKRKKDTKRWCKGIEGREHATQWEYNHHYSGLDKYPGREYLHEILVCVNCRRELAQRTIHRACGQVHDGWGFGNYFKNRETGRYEKKPFPCETKAA